MLQEPQSARLAEHVITVTLSFYFTMQGLPNRYDRRERYNLRTSSTSQRRDFPIEMIDGSVITLAFSFYFTTQGLPNRYKWRERYNPRFHPLLHDAGTSRPIRLAGTL